MSLPRHVGIIMDGNGRWAKKRNLPKIMGHKEGGQTVDRIVEDCARRGIQALTLYSFSTENWARPKVEVDALMALFQETMKEKSQKLHSNNVKFQVIGRVSELPGSLRAEIKRIEDMTFDNTGLVLSLAINYGGRQEIFDAFRGLFKETTEKNIDLDSLDESSLERHLYTRGLPELDLIIRTSGEMRLSNFLIWQAAYSELYVTDVLWPDFGPGDMDKALESYDKRDRRYGG